MTADILAELKSRTAELHRDIEAVVPLMDPALTLERYAEYLAHLYPWYGAVEARLSAIAGLRAVAPDIDTRWKTEILARDLRALGRPAETDIDLSRVPDLRSIPQALGCLYVLEGSTLGAQILVRAVRSSLGAEVAGKTRFLAGYEENTALRWRRLCLSLSSFLTRADNQEIAVLTARATFSGLHEWLLRRQSFSEAEKELIAR
ncbi:MAG TPA: biliverdin-producing heme oxygenase [Bryobacteraceae bacterium]